MTLKNKQPNKLTLQDYAREIAQGNRVALARGITLIESNLPSDRIKGQQLIELLLPLTGKAVRLGITGVPGVGKSTFIEVLGKYITGLSKKIAVLAIDPSSAKTKGSILGDKTRMEELSKDAQAYIRPTATGTALGGVATRTREAMLLCEAAGFDVVIVETVGVGQSEVMVKEMVDYFLLLMLPGAGDDLQGIKKGIMEMADGIAITKAEHENLKKAKQAQADLTHALHLFQAPASGVATPVLLTSATEKIGIEEVWKKITAFMETTEANGFLTRHRQEQNVKWFQQCLAQLLLEEFQSSTKLARQQKDLEEQVKKGVLLPTSAARQLVKAFWSA